MAGKIRTSFFCFRSRFDREKCGFLSMQSKNALVHGSGVCSCLEERAGLPLAESRKTRLGSRNNSCAFNISTY